MIKTKIKSNYLLLIILFKIFLFQNILYAESIGVDFEKKISASNPLSPSKTHTPEETFFEFVDKTNKAISIIYEIESQVSLDDGLFHSEEILEQAKFAKILLKKAIQTLDLSEVPKSNRKRIGFERVLMLKDILDRVVLPEGDSIPKVKGDDNQTLKYWQIPNTELVIERSIKGKNIAQYLFSPETIKNIPMFFERIKHLEPLRNKHDEYNTFYDFYSGSAGDLLPPKWSLLLPDWSKGELYWNQTIWQWIVLVITLLLGILISIFLFKWKNRKKSVVMDSDYTFYDIFLPITLLGILFSIDYLFEDVINITSDVSESISFLINLLIYLITSWMVYISVNWIAEKFWKSDKINGNNTIDASVIKTLFRLLSIIASTTVLYFGAQSLGIPIAPLLAAFGALGIAMGFGAQEYFKNVVGGLTLFLDRPVRVGEFCEFNGITGMIEDIGLRSTKIRTSNKQLVIVSNSVFSTANITNHSRIESRVLKITLGLLYDTDETQLLNIIEKTNNYFDKCSSIKSHRVRLVELGPYSIDIDVYSEVLIVNFAEFLEFKEKFLFEVMQIVKSEGTDFAYPSQTLYLDGDIKK